MLKITKLPHLDYNLGNYPLIGTRNRFPMSWTVEDFKKDTLKYSSCTTLSDIL